MSLGCLGGGRDSLARNEALGVGQAARRPPLTSSSAFSAASAWIRSRSPRPVASSRWFCSGQKKKGGEGWWSPGPRRCPRPALGKPPPSLRPPVASSPPPAGRRLARPGTAAPSPAEGRRGALSRWPRRQQRARGGRVSHQLARLPAELAVLLFQPLHHGLQVLQLLGGGSGLLQRLLAATGGGTQTDTGALARSQTPAAPTVPVPGGAEHPAACPGTPGGRQGSWGGVGGVSTHGREAPSPAPRWHRTVAAEPSAPPSPQPGGR